MEGFEPDRVFAVLEPLNRDAVLAFDAICNAIDQDETRYSHHQKFVRREPVQVLLRDALHFNRDHEDSGQSPSLSTSFVSSEATIPDEDVDPENRLVWSGCYTFSFKTAPHLNRIGWLIGYGHHWDKDALGNVDLLLATDYIQGKAAQLHGIHARFNVLDGSGAFGIKSGANADTILDTKIIRRSDGFAALRDPEHSITFGGLLFRFRYCVPDAHDDEFQAQKRRYMMENLQMESPIPHTMVTPSMRDVKIGKWTLLKTAGEGTQAVIKAAISPANETVAVRSLHDTTPAKACPLIEELNDIKKATSAHQNILRLLEVLETPSGVERRDYFLLLTPLVRSDFHTAVLSVSQPLSQAVRMALFTEIVRGLSALHAAGYIHRDIKPANLGVVSLSPPQAVILDLGQVKYIGSGETKATPGCNGTVGYLAPEVEASNSSYGFPSDIWALGCVGYQMFVGAIPWRWRFNPWRDPASFKLPIDFGGAEHQKNLFRSELSKLSTSDEPIRILLHEMLNEDPEQRITSREVLQWSMRQDIGATENTSNTGKRKQK